MYQRGGGAGPYSPGTELLTLAQIASRFRLFWREARELADGGAFGEPVDDNGRPIARADARTVRRYRLDAVERALRGRRDGG